MFTIPLFLSLAPSSSPHPDVLFSLGSASASPHPYLLNLLVSFSPQNSPFRHACANRLRRSTLAFAQCSQFRCLTLHSDSASAGPYLHFKVDSSAFLDSRPLPLGPALFFLSYSQSLCPGTKCCCLGLDTLFPLLIIGSRNATPSVPQNLAAKSSRPCTRPV